MGLRSAKSTAIIFVILFVGYYQRWLFVPILEAISGPLNVDPGDVPDLLRELNERKNALRLDSSSFGIGIGKGAAEKRQPVEPEAVIEANKLSLMIQRHLEIRLRGQSLTLMMSGCRTPKLVCGAPVDCGLGCQIRYVMSCTMAAYLTNRTLVMTWDNWPYKEMAWSDVFLPVGISDCPIDNDTASIIWTPTGIEISYPELKSFPYKSGIPIPYPIADVLKHLPTNQLLWWNGQFAKFVMRLQLTEEELVAKLKNGLNLLQPTVGILMRRRDKLSEKKVKSTPTSIDKYMTTARKYFSKLEEAIPSVKRRVYIATDDRNIIKLVRKRYRPPKWEILGHQMKTELEDLLKDIYLLKDCGFVICTFSADICRLVLEMKESLTLGSSDHVKSLDQKYTEANPGFKRLQFLQQII